MDLQMLKRRSEIIRKTRSFFESKNYLETDTPLLVPDLIPESCLEVFQTMRIFPGLSPAMPLWLIPSPEISMKKIIAQHSVNIFQICKCFRNGESTGHLHNHEFTMLEYYTMDADYLDSLRLTREFFSYLTPESPEFICMTMAEAFSRWAGFDLFYAAEKPGGLENEARRLGLEPKPGLNNQVLFDLIFIHVIEPKLREETLVALLDYPAFIPCLAKKNNKTVERWELYANGIELANCYSEETDPALVRAFFEKEAAAKEKSALIRHNVDQNYWKIFENKNKRYFPRCSGVALGLDRLIMYICEKRYINQVLFISDQ